METTNKNNKDISVQHAPLNNENSLSEDSVEFFSEFNIFWRPDCVRFIDPIIRRVVLHVYDLQEGAKVSLIFALIRTGWVTQMTYPVAESRKTKKFIKQYLRTNQDLDPNMGLSFVVALESYALRLGLLVNTIEGSSSRLVLGKDHGLKPKHMNALFKDVKRSEIVSSSYKFTPESGDLRDPTNACDCSYYKLMAYLSIFVCFVLNLLVILIAFYCDEKNEEIVPIMKRIDSSDSFDTIDLKGGWEKDLTTEGIEPNPGPSLALMYLVYFELDFVILFLMVYYLTKSLVYERDLNMYVIKYVLIQFLLGVSSTIRNQWVRDLTSEGVEPNPGPVLSTLIGCTTKPVEYWEMESGKGRRKQDVTFRASDIKAKRVLRHLKREAAKLDKFIRKSRDLKYEPEGFFELDLGHNTREFVSDTIAQCSGAMDNFTARLESVLDKGTSVRVDTGFSRALQSIVDTSKTAGTVVWNFLKACFDFVIKLVSGYRSMEPESGISEIETNWVEALMSSFSHLFPTTYVEKFVTFVTSAHDMKTFTTRTTDKFLGLCTFIISVVKKIAAFFCGFYGIPVPEIFDDSHPELKDIFSRLTTLRDEYKNGIVSQASFCERVYSLRCDIECKMETDSREHRAQHDYILKSLKPLIDVCDRAALASNRTRTEPVGICIAGTSGAGKSTATMPIALGCLAGTLSKDLLPEFKRNHNEFIYYRFTGNVYHDGYKNRCKMVVFDDFGQQRDSVGSPNEDVMEIIRWINTTPFLLHMSAIEDKEKYYGNPDFVLASTNLKKFAFPSIHCPKAIARRFRLAYMQVPKEEFTLQPMPESIEDRELDVDKVREKFPLYLDGSNYMVEEVMDFIPWDFVEGKRARGPSLTYTQLVKKAISTLEQSKMKGDSMMNFFDSLKDRFTPESGSDGSGEETLSDHEEFYDAKSHFSVDSAINSALRALCERAGVPCFELNPDPGLWFYKLLGVLGFASFALGAYYLGRSFFAKNPENGSGNNTKKDVVRKPNKPRERPKISIKPPQSVIKPEGGDKQAVDWLLKMLKRNVYRLYTDGVYIGQAIFIKGTTFLVPAHFEFLIGQRVEFVPFSAGSEIVAFTVDFDSDIIEDCHVHGWNDELPDRNYPDLELMTLDPKKVRDHADISKHLVTSDAIGKDNKYASYIPVLRDGNIVIHSVQVTSGLNEPSYKDSMSLYNAGSLKYSFSSAKGDCGTPIVTVDPRFGIPVLLGFHTAGSYGSFFGSKQCLGVHLDRGLVDYVLSEMRETVSISEDFEVDYSTEGNTAFNHLYDAEQPRRPIKSKIIPSPMHGKLWAVTTKPCHLKPFTDSSGNVIDPEALAVSKYVHKEIYVDSALLDVVYPFVVKSVMTNTAEQPWKPRLFSLEEAACGISGVEFCDMVSRRSSPGYPWMISTTNGKKKWLGEDGPVDITSDGFNEFTKIVEDRLNSYKQGVRKPVVFVDMLKDARNPIEKVEKGKTRQYMACPMDFLVVMKMYFGDFFRFLKSNRIFNSMSVGLDVYSEWDTLGKYLNKGDRLFLAGDYSAYDGKIPIPVMFRCLDIVETFYTNSTSEDRKIRRMIMLDIVNSFHLLAGKVHERFGGNPSGQPGTTELNSLCNFIMICCAVVRDATPEQINELLEDLRAIFCGDDHAVSFDKKFAEFYHQSRIQKNLKELFNMDYTDEQKTGELFAARKITEITFLKRSFRSERGRWYAPLELSVILETLNWMRSSSSRRELELRVEAVLTELAMHGEKVFEAYRSKIVEASSLYLDYKPINTIYSVALNSDTVLGLTM